VKSRWVGGRRGRDSRLPVQGWPRFTGARSSPRVACTSATAGPESPPAASGRLARHGYGRAGTLLLGLPAAVAGLHHAHHPAFALAVQTVLVEKLDDMPVASAFFAGGHPGKQPLDPAGALATIAESFVLPAHAAFALADGAGNLLRLFMGGVRLHGDGPAWPPADPGRGTRTDSVGRRRDCQPSRPRA